MKATMNEDGMITISAESSLEAYALRKWTESAQINIVDVARAETGYWRDSKLMVDASWNSEQSS